MVLAFFSMFLGKGLLFLHQVKDLQMKNRFVKIALSTLLMTVAGTAAAEVPAEATAAVTGILTDGSALIAQYWPVLTAIVGSLTLMKLFKKGTSRAT